MIVGIMALSACGFTPAYGPNGAAGKVQGQVATTTPDTISGFYLRNQIVDRIGSGGRFALDVSIAESRDAVAISQTGDTTRFNIIGTADWILRDGNAGAILAQGRAESFTSYAATGTTVTSQSSASDARRRLMVILADQIVAEVMLAAPDIQP